MPQPTSITNDPIVVKIMHFCSYRDRSHHEVRYKLVEYGARGDKLEDIMSFLIKENYLNEERFARSFVRGKFRIKGWGRNKIRQALKQHRISDYCMRKGMSEIDEGEYYDKLESLAERKWELVREKNVFKKRKKVADSLIRKGYESGVTWEVVGALNE